MRTGASRFAFTIPLDENSAVDLRGTGRNDPKPKGEEKTEPKTGLAKYIITVDLATKQEVGNRITLSESTMRRLFGKGEKDGEAEGSGSCA